MSTAIRYADGNINVDLKVHWSRWSDPGCYPSGAGGGPLPDGPEVVEDIDGHLEVLLTPETRWELVQYPTLSDWAEDNLAVRGLPVRVTKWGLRARGDRVIAWPERWEETY